MQKPLILVALITGCVSTLTVLFVFGGAEALRANLETAWQNPASVFFQQSITAKEIQNTYEDAERRKRAERVRVLIVPGHQPSKGGTAYGSVYERDVVVKIAEALGELLAADPHYEVMLARNQQGWHRTHFMSARLPGPKGRVRAPRSRRINRRAALKRQDAWSLSRRKRWRATRGDSEDARPGTCEVMPDRILPRDAPSIRELHIKVTCGIVYPEVETYYNLPRGCE